MTEEQKIKIRRMRLDGNGYKHIASTLILPLSTVKTKQTCRHRTSGGNEQRCICTAWSYLPELRKTA